MHVTNFKLSQQLWMRPENFGQFYYVVREYAECLFHLATPTFTLALRDNCLYADTKNKIEDLSSLLLASIQNWTLNRISD